MIIVPANSASAAGGFSVANSCRFNDGDSPELHKTPGSAGNQDSWTFSIWLKRGELGATQKIFNGKSDSSNYQFFAFNTSDQLTYYSHFGGASKGELTTNRVFRDVGAWYNITFIHDSGNGTAGDRLQYWVNGVRETSFAASSFPDQNQDGIINASGAKLSVASNQAAQYFDGYISEVVFLDAVTASPVDTLGEFDSDSPTIWKPKKVSGLTFGTNGFYLDFKDSSNLGNDANGGTDFTEVNLAAADQATDTPTNNFCVINSLDNEFAEATLSEGNCNTAMSASKYNYITSTFGLSKGKWYFEAKLTAAGGTAATVGIAASPTSSASDYLGGDADGATILYQISGSGNKSILHGTEASYGSTSIAVNSVLGIYIDLDNNKAYGSVNGTLQSATGLNITAPASTVNGWYSPAFGDYDGSDAYTFAVNFGGCPAFSISSGNTDDNDYGNFEYSPNITGDGSAKSFYAICTKNLAEYG